MKTKTLTLTVLALLAVTFLAGPAFAGAKDDIIAKLKDLEDEVLKAKDAGEIGEMYSGYLGVRDSDASATKKLVKDVNELRSELFEIVAEESGATKEQVAARFRVNRYEKASPDHWLTKPDNETWYQKKDK